MRNGHTLQQKTKVMTKLYESGCRSEKDLQLLTAEDMVKIKGININEMTIIIELQKQVKANRLFSYMGEAYGAAQEVKKEGASDVGKA